MAQTRMAICLADPAQEDMPLVFVNRAFTRLTGYSEDEVVGRNCRFLQGPGTDPAEVGKVRRALENEDVVVVELLNYRKDGTTFWNALHLGPIYSDTGTLLYYFGSQWDVSDVRAARADEQHAKMLARELSHRMKNMFAVIGGLVTATGRSRNIRAEAAEINDRIRALGRAFETTLDDAAVGTIDLRQAIEAVLRPYDPEGERIRLAGDALRVNPNLISIVGLALHELATNAVKYGALSNESGNVYDELVGIRDGRRRRESNGRSLAGDSCRPECAERDSGSGMNIVETLLATIDGSIERRWTGDGLRARIVIPATEEP